MISIEPDKSAECKLLRRTDLINVTSRDAFTEWLWDGPSLRTRGIIARGVYVRIYTAFKLDQNASAVHLLRALYLSRLHRPRHHITRTTSRLYSTFRPVVSFYEIFRVQWSFSYIFSFILSFLHLVTGGPVSRKFWDRVLFLISPQVLRNRTLCVVHIHIIKRRLNPFYLFSIGTRIFSIFWII